VSAKIHAERHLLPPAARVVAAALVVAALLGGCGSASAPPTAASTGSAPSSGTVSSTALVFARCMRSSGVTNFPDPTPGHGLGFNVSAAVSSSPAFHKAMAGCQKLLPIDAPGGGRPASRQTMAKLLGIARCMRGHGVHQFPDPYDTRPSNITPGKYSVITDFDGAFLLFPRAMNLQAPAYRQALAACGAPPLGLPH
jgi:hypothetical protein